MHGGAAQCPRRSPAGLTVWVAAHERELGRAAAAATVTEREFEIDGARARFHVASAGSNWAAGRRHDGMQVTVSGRGISPDELALARLPEPIAALLESPGW